MPANTADHDTLVYRLAHILSKLNQGQKLDPQALAEEFNVNRRTIQRDLNERFAYLSLEKVDGLYHLPPSALGKLSLRDIERFASLAGVRGLFPSLSDDFLRDIFDNRVQSALLVKGPQFEDLGDKKHLFAQLEQAILQFHPVTYSYEKSDGAKTYTDIEPYKLVNHDGIWYLAGKDKGRLKSFTFTKINRLQVSVDTFASDPTVNATLMAEDDIWLNEKKLEVVLQISAEVAGYFKRRKLVADQRIEEELVDGSLIISSRVAHVNQILPTVRQWIPNIRIVKPEYLQGEMEEELLRYLPKYRFE